MELVLPMYNAHLYFSIKTLDKKVLIIHSKIWYHFSSVKVTKVREKHNTRCCCVYGETGISTFLLETFIALWELIWK